ncbi:MAG: hypothetical protein V9E96_02665 [Chitinophagaceae bacterium]|jgi:hypothetical protein
MQEHLVIFNLKQLKKQAIVFICINCVIVISAYLLSIWLQNPIQIPFTENTGQSILIFLFIVPILIYKGGLRKKLQTIQTIENTEEKFQAYEILARKRLFWNSLIITFVAILYLSSYNKYMLYLLIIQCIISCLQFPKKKLIQQELNNPELLFL